VFVVLGQEGTIMSQVPWLEKFMDRAHMTLLERVGRLVNTILHALEHVEGDDARIGAVLPMFHRVRMEMDRIKQQYEDESVPEHVEHMRGLQEKLKERVQRMLHSHRWVCAATFLTPYVHEFDEKEKELYTSFRADHLKYLREVTTSFVKKRGSEKAPHWWSLWSSSLV
jgi:hypothetical protein